MASWKTAAMLAGGACAVLAGSALAQQAATGTPPPWDTLVHCAEIGDRDERLTCFDGAMRSAGYAPKAEAVVEARRKTFGLTIPQISILKHKDKPAEAAAAGAGAAPAEVAQAAPEKAKKKRGKTEPAPALANDENSVTLILAKVAAQGTGRLLMITDEGQIWEQVNDEPVAPLPKEGATMTVHKGQLGSFFCDLNKYKSIRCKRLR